MGTHVMSAEKGRGYIHTHDSVFANVLPSTSTNAGTEDSSKSKKKPASANPSGIRRGRKPYPLDANGNKIRPEKENQKTGQKQKKSK